MIVIEGQVLQDIEGIDVNEKKLIANSISKRKKEFATSRIFAKQAFRKMGIYDSVSLLCDENRCPIWPKNVIGSISHTGSYCAVAIASINEYRGVGIDIEEIDRLSLDMKHIICHGIEHEYITSKCDKQNVEMLATIFSIKESFYKMQYLVTKSWVGFHDVLCDVIENGRIRISICKNIGNIFNKSDVVYGRYLVSNNNICTAVYLEA